MLQTWSPDWLTEKIETRWSIPRRNLALKLSSSKILTFTLALILLTCGALMAYFWTPPPIGSLTFNIAPLDFLTRMIYRGPIAVGWILIGASLLLVLPKFRKVIEFLTYLAALTSLVVASGAIANTTILAFLVTAGIPALGFFYYLQSKSKHGFILMLLSLPVSIAVGQILSNNGLLDGANFFTNQPRYFMVFWLYAAEYRANATAFAPYSNYFWSYVFSPAQLITNICMPSPTFNRDGNHIEEIFKGLEIFFVCVVYMTLVIFLFKNVNRDQFRVLDPIAFFTFGILNYLKYYFLSFASQSLAECGYRLLGYSTLPMFRTPLLAANPFERWQRWSTSFYEFLKFLVFLPLLRILKSPLIAILITFWVSCLIHEMAFFLRLSDEAASTFNLRQGLLRMFFFTLHGLVVYGSFKFARLWPSGKLRSGWKGCLLTFVIMAAIHVFAP